MIMGIVGLAKESYLVLVIAKDLVGKVNRIPIYKIRDVVFIPFNKLNRWVQPPDLELPFGISD